MITTFYDDFQHNDDSAGNKKSTEPRTGWDLAELSVYLETFMASHQKSSAPETGFLQVFDNSGKLILKEATHALETLACISNLAPGTYFLKFGINQEMQKLVIQPR